MTALITTLVPGQRLPHPYLGRLKELRRMRRRRAMASALHQGHTLSRWVPLFWVQPCYRGMWARVCGRCGRRIIAITFPWHVSLDGTEDAGGSAVSQACEYRPTLFDTPLPAPTDGSFPLPVEMQYVSVGEAIGYLPAPQIGTKGPVRYCYGPQIDDRTGLCRMCGLPHE